MKEPTARELRRWVRYIESLGLSVYGPCVDLDTGIQYGACTDYGPDQVVKMRSLVRRGIEIRSSQDDDDEY